MPYDGKDRELVLPHNLQAEQGLLGALLIDPAALERVPDSMVPDHFYAPAHRRIFEAIRAIADKGQAPNPVMLKNYFEHDDDLKHVGGSEYIADLAMAAFGSFNTADYCITIMDLALRRDVICMSQQAIGDSLEVALDRPGRAVLEDLESGLFALAEKGVQSGPAGMDVHGRAALENISRAQRGEIRGIHTGIAAIDEKLLGGGLLDANLYLLAARPSMGKTVLGVNIADNAARAGFRPLFFSLEMSAPALVRRMIARRSGFPVQQLAAQDGLKQDQWRAVMEAQQDIAALPLFIDDTPALNLAQIRQRARRQKRRGGLDLIVIDYLSMIELEDRYRSKTDQIGEVSRGLKNIARELDVPVLLLVQLNRDVEKRDSKKPGLSDLRDSGNLEQDADVVMFIYRQEYYLKRGGEPEQQPRESEEDYRARLLRYHEICDAAEGRGEILIEKQRDGEIGVCRVMFDGKSQLFYDEETPAQ